MNSGIDIGGTVASSLSPRVIRRLLVPWYWTDDIARALIEAGRMTVDAAGPLMSVPSAIRREEPTIDAAALAMLDDDEIPLAA